MHLSFIFSISIHTHIIFAFLLCSVWPFLNPFSVSVEIPCHLHLSRVVRLRFHSFNMGLCVWWRWCLPKRLLDMGRCVWRRWCLPSFGPSEKDRDKRKKTSSNGGIRTVVGWRSRPLDHHGPQLCVHVYLVHTQRFTVQLKSFWLK